MRKRKIETSFTVLDLTVLLLIVIIVLALLIGATQPPT